jgi:transmembrane sensor
MTQGQAQRLDLLQREAIAWVQRIDSGQATSADAETLQQWCATSQEHAAAFAAASGVWRDIQRAGASIPRSHREALPVRQTSRPTLDRRVILGGGLAAAAAAAVHAVVNPPLGLWPSLTELSADYRTVVGEQRQVRPAEMVAVRMNTQTSITVHAGDSETDRLELVAGQALFEAAESRRPLVVLAADGRSIGRRARFDVRRMNGPAGAVVRVTCFDGEVRIERNADSATIGPAQSVRYDAGGVGRVAAIDAEAESAWQRGIVLFRATPLAEVVEEINRYRSGRILLVNAGLAQKPVSGRFRIDQMDEILARLEQAFDVRTRKLPGGLVLLG